MPSSHAHPSERQCTFYISLKRNILIPYIVKFMYWAESFKFRVRGNLGVHRMSTHHLKADYHCMWSEFGIGSSSQRVDGPTQTIRDKMGRGVGHSSGLSPLLDQNYLFGCFGLASWVLTLLLYFPLLLFGSNQENIMFGDSWRLASLGSDELLHLHH